MEGRSQARSCRPVTLSQPHEPPGLPLPAHSPLWSFLSLGLAGRRVASCWAPCWGLEDLGTEPGSVQVRD